MNRRQFSKSGFMLSMGMMADAVTGNPIKSVDSLGRSNEESAIIKPFSRSFDVIVIGGGPAGFGAAMRAARQGAQTMVTVR